MAPKFVMSFKLNNSNVTDTIKNADDSKSIFSPTHTLLLSCIQSLHALIEFNDYAGHIVTAYSLALMHGIGAVMIHNCLNHCRKIIQFYVVHYCLLYGAIFFVFTRGDFRPRFRTHTLSYACWAPNLLLRVFDVKFLLSFLYNKVTSLLASHTVPDPVTGLDYEI